MLPTYCCPSCAAEFSDHCLPKKLPNCSHTICERCADNVCTHVMGFHCPVCKAPVNAHGSKDLPTEDIIFCQQYQAEKFEQTFQAHIIGHKWLGVLRDCFNLSDNVNFSFKILVGDTFAETIRLANRGSLQQYKNVIVFGCIPLAWHIHRPKKFNKLALFIPNKNFNQQVLKDNIRVLMEALTSHRPDTHLYIFLPPIIDVNRFNTMQLRKANLNYKNVISVCREILPYNIASHTRLYFNCMKPHKFIDMPSNIHFIRGYEIAMKVCSHIGENTNSYMKSKTKELYLEDLFVNGIFPTDKFASEICQSLSKSINEQIWQDCSIQTTSSLLSIQPGLNARESFMEDVVQGKNKDAMHCDRKLSCFKTAYQPSNESLSNQSINITNTKELTVEDSRHLIDATREEILRSAVYIKEARDRFYPSVTNKKLTEAALKAVLLYF